MAKAKPRRDFHPVGWAKDYAFSFTEEQKQTLINKTGIQEDAFIRALEVQISTFRFLQDTGLKKPTDAEVKAALDDLEAKTKAMLEGLKLDQITSNVLLEPLYLANGDTNILKRLKEELSFLLTLTRRAQQEFRPRRGRRREPGRATLALDVAKCLIAYEIQPTTYNQGPYYQCLKICLQVVGDIPADNDYHQYAPNIKDLVGWAVKELPNRAL